MSAETFRKALTLTEVAASVYDRAFMATPQYVPWPKAYGGDMLAQAAAAAMATVDRDRALHSLHSSFLRPVDMHVEVRYEVELLRDGRGYSTRHVRGFQHGKATVLTTASFQVPEDGPRFAPELPDDPASWQFKQFWPTDLHRMAIAVRRVGADLPIQMEHVVVEAPR